MWQNVDGIFLRQGKCTIEILKRFKNTPMASNPKLLSIASSESVDATMYCQMIYLTNTRPDICFAVKTLRHVHLMVANHAMRYLRGIVDYGLKYEVK